MLQSSWGISKSSAVRLYAKLIIRAEAGLNNAERDWFFGERNSFITAGRRDRNGIFIVNRHLRSDYFCGVIEPQTGGCPRRQSAQKSRRERFRILIFLLINFPRFVMSAWENTARSLLICVLRMGKFTAHREQKMTAELMKIVARKWWNSGRKWTGNAGEIRLKMTIETTSNPERNERFAAGYF